MYASAGFARGLVRGRNPFTGAWKGLTGVKETTFSDVLGDMGMKRGLPREVAGFVGDVLLDPITYLGGLSVAGKLTARGAQVQSKMVRAARGMVGKRMSRELGGKALGEVEESVAKEALRRIAKDLKIPDLYDKLVTTSPEMMAAHLAERRMTGAVARHPRFVPPRAIRLAGVPVAPISAQQAVGRGIQHLGRLAAEIPGIREVVKGGRELGAVARKAFVTTPPGPYGKEIKRIADFARESANVDKHALVEEVREMVRKMTTGVLKGKSPTQREEVIGEVTRLLQPIEKKIYNLPPEEAARELIADVTDLRDKLARVEKKIPIEAQVGEKFAPGVPAAAPREVLLREKAGLEARRKSLRERYKRETAEMRKAEAAVGKPPAKVKKRVAERIAKEPKEKVKRAARREAMKSLEVHGIRASVQESKRVLERIRHEGGVFWSDIDEVTGKWKDMEEIMELPKHIRVSAARIQSVRLGRAKGKSGIGIDELADEWGVTSSEAVKIIKEHHKVVAEGVEGAVEEVLPMARKLAKKKAEARILKELVHEQAVKQRKVARGVSGLRKETLREGTEVRSQILEVDKRLAAVKEAPVEVASKRRLAKINKIQDRVFKHEKAIKSLPKAKELLGEETVRSIKKVATIEDEKIEGTFEWAQELRKKLDDLHAGEKDLPVPPRYRPGYFPHIMKPEYRKILHKAFLQDPQRMAGYPKGAKLGSSLQRVFEGTVTEYTLDDLMRHGFINMKAAMDVLRKAGKKIPSEDLIFETNPLEVYFKRKVKSINARTNVQMQEAMIQELSPFSTTLDDWGGIKAFIKREPDHVVYVTARDYRKILTTKQIDEIYKGDPAAALKAGIEEIRPVSKDLKKLLKQAKGKNIVAFMVPREAADHLVNMFKVIESDDAMREAGYMWDKVTGYWKTWATVPRPAFHVRNAFSNLWQNYLAGMGLRSLKYYAMAAQLHAKKGTSLKGLKGVGHFSAEDVMALAEMHGVLKGGYVGGDVLQDVGHRLFPTVWNPLSEGGFVIRGMAKLPQAYENNARLAHFLWMMDKTGDATAAAMSVKKHLFDYQDLTHFEKTVMKRIAPFYSWTRKNIPLQAEKFITDPGKFLALSKAQAAVERLSAGDENVLDRKHVASWIRDANGVRIKVDKDGKHHFWLMSGWIPAADLSKFDAGELLNMMHPLPKLVLEKSINKEFFSGRKIARFPGEKIEFLGLTMPPSVRHVLKQMVILNEIDRISRDKGTPGQIIARTIIRTYPQDPTRALTRYVIETRAEMSRYKKDYKKAVAKHGEDSMIPRALKSQVDRLEKELEDAKKEGKRRDPKFMRWRKKQSAAPRTMQALKARASARIYSRFKEAASAQ